MGEAFPAAPDPDDLGAGFGGSVDEALDDRVEARDIPAAREDTDPLARRHARAILSRRPWRVPLRFGVRRAGPTVSADPSASIGHVNYELFMGEALAEAQLAASLGERPIAAVAVVDEAMVARAHDRVEQADDPTAHAVVVALREAARKLGRSRLADATIFATLEPCAMCIGALLESDVEALVYAVANTRDGAAGTVIQLAQHPSLPRRIKVVSGIRRDEAEALFAVVPTG